MTDRDVFRLLVEFPWIVFVVYWIIGAIKTRATREKEPFISRIAVLLVEGVGYLLIFNGSMGIGFLGTRFVPRTMAGAILGVVLTGQALGCRSGRVITWLSFGARGSPSKRTISSSALVPTLTCDIRFIPGSSSPPSVRLWSSTSGDACWEFAWCWPAIVSKRGRKKRCLASNSETRSASTRNTPAS